MAKIMRHLVSKKKRRFEWGEFDLDLSYITDRIVAMGFPSESLEGLYRNNMKDVQKFFDSLHPSRYRIYNLCSERKYDPAKFGGNVREFPFDDHGPPNLDVIEQFCMDVTKWLDAHPENVIGVHCKAGKGRTGTLVSCFLIYSGYCQSASEACRLFGNKRTVNGKGITIPSQFRYVRYFEQMLLQSKPPPAPLRLPPSATLVLNTILMYGVPNFNIGGGCEPYLGISQRNKSVYSSKPLKIKKGTEIVEFDCGETILARDVKIQFFNKSSKGKMFSLCFHTGYVSGNRLKLRRLELDRASKDAAHKHFSPNFMIELVFRPVAEVAKDIAMLPTEGGEAVTPVTIQVFICASCNKPISEDDASVHHMERNWHWGCMRCSVCHQGLKDDMIFDKEGKPVCATCDKSTGFFKFCNSCGLLINSHISEDYGDASYHKECFECFDCGRYLNGVTFSANANKKLICEHCLNKAIPPAPASPKPVRVPTPPPEPVPEPKQNGHMEPPKPEPPKPEPPKPAPPPPVVKPVTHSRACPGCRSEVSMSSDCIVALGTLWHKHCFVCAQCRKAFIGNKYFIRDDKAYCEGCDTSTRLAMLSKCMACDEFIEDAELTEALGGMWHLDCFVCFHCKNPIAGPFASRDGKVYCKPDYENLFCTRCSGCSRIIQGSFFRALDKAYHMECFQCIRCGNNLVSGQYFEIGGRPCCFPCKEATKFGAGKTQNATSSPVQSKFLCEHRSDSRLSQQLPNGDEIATIESVSLPPPSPSTARVSESSSVPKPTPTPLPSTPPSFARASEPSSGLKSTPTAIPSTPQSSARPSEPSSAQKSTPPSSLPPGSPSSTKRPEPAAVQTSPPPLSAPSALPPPPVDLPPPILPSAPATLPPPAVATLPPPAIATLPPPPAETSLPPPPATIAALPPLPVSSTPAAASTLPPAPISFTLPPPPASILPPPVVDFPLPPPPSDLPPPASNLPPPPVVNFLPTVPPVSNLPPTSNLPIPISNPPPANSAFPQSTAGRATSPPSRISLALSSLPPPPPAPVIPGLTSSSPTRNSPPFTLATTPPAVTRTAFVTARPSQPTRQLSLSGGLLASSASSSSNSAEGSPHAFLSARAAAAASSASASASVSAVCAVSAPTPVPAKSESVPIASSLPFGTTPPASARPVPIPTSPGGSPTLLPSSPPPVPRLLRTSDIGTPPISPPSSPTMRSAGAGARNSPQRVMAPSSPMQNRTLGFKTTSISSLPPPPPSPFVDPQLLQRHNSDMSLLDNKSEAQRPDWQPDDAAMTCPLCFKLFTVFYRKHHCRACGKVVCGECSSKKCKLPHKKHKPTRVCDECYRVHRVKRRSLSMSHIQHTHTLHHSRSELLHRP